MIKNIISLIKIFEKKDKISFFKIQILVLIMIIFQLLSITSFAPFLSLVLNPEILSQENLITTIFLISGLDASNFIFYSGVFLIVIICISSFLSIKINWILLSFSYRMGMSLSTKLLDLYLSRDYLFHMSNSSSYLMKQVIVEVRRVGDGLITPLIQFVSNCFFVTIVIIALTIYDTQVTLIGGVILIMTFLIIYAITKNQIKRNGENITKMSLLRSKISLNSFGAIREIIHRQNRKHFISKFEKTSLSFAKSQAKNSVYSILPKYIVEFLTFSGVILFILAFIKPGSENFTEFIPMVVVFGLLLLKLIPSFQNIFGNLSKIRANIPAFISLKDDFFEMKNLNRSGKDLKKIKFQHNLEIKNLNYKYPGERNAVLHGVNLKINKNSTVGIVGYSGSGKSTLADIIIGFLSSYEGEIFIDGKMIGKNEYSAFKRNIGFVSQSIFLLDSSITENIAFGVDQKKINHKKLDECIEKANLNKLISDLPNGIDTEVGERGIQLSGGQIQRIAIARALYLDCEILVFDEATSSLDGITEKNILDSIESLQKTKTIIMVAHRLTTLIGCDKIYVLDKGKIDDIGDFETLSKQNKLFIKMLNDK